MTSNASDTTLDLEHISGSIPKIRNVVATCKLNVRVDLTDFTLKVRNTEYHPASRPPVVIRIRDPRSTALLHASGSMLVNGTTSEDDARLAARKFARIVQKEGYDVRLKDFKIVNIIASGPVGSPLEGISLRNIAIDFPSAKFEPEEFPNLHWKMLDPKVAYILSSKGKITITGAKSTKEVHTAWKKMVAIARRYPLPLTESPKKLKPARSRKRKRSIQDCEDGRDPALGSCPY